ncbi:MAG: hypothetical protein ABR514_08345 [Chthoniobacterales bacterium]
MKRLLITATLVWCLAVQASAGEQSVLARVTVYWPGEGGILACSNGARLRPGHCAVDPQKIPYGSKVYFPDGPCVAVDTGPAVVNRKAARLSGRNARERGALVIDRFFETKAKGLAWEREHPHFMTLRVVSRRSSARPHPESIAGPRPDIKRVAQANSPPPVAQAEAPAPVRHAGAGLPVALTQNDSIGAIVFRNPAQSLVSAPPSYHRRRFAAGAKDEIEVPPPSCTTTTPRRSRLT